MDLIIHSDRVDVANPNTLGFPLSIQAGAGEDGKCWLAQLGPPEPGSTFTIGRTFKNASGKGARHAKVKTFKVKVPGIYEVHNGARVYIRVEQNGNAAVIPWSIAQAECLNINPMYQAKGTALDASQKFMDAVETLAKLNPAEAGDVLQGIVDWIQGGALSPRFDPAQAVQEMHDASGNEQDQEKEVQDPAEPSNVAKTDPTVFHF